MTFKMHPFVPRFPWWGGFLQTVATSVRPAPRSFGRHETEPREFALRDGTGDRMLGMLDRPQAPVKGLPLVILMHGMPGDAHARYMIELSRFLVDRGYRVLRLNLRGAGPSGTTCRRQYSAASSEDLRHFFEVVPDDLRGDGMVAVGFSVGGAILLKYLGEQGDIAEPPPLEAACTISAPVDLLGTCRDVMSPLFRWMLFPEMKRQALRAQLSQWQRENVEASTTILELDERFGGPRRGFKGAADYYAASSAAQYLDRIRVPTLVIAALDDPWVPGGVYTTQLWRKNPYLTPLLPLHGGHVGFHGIADRQPWCDVAVAKFIESVV